MRQADITSGKTKQQAWREGWSVILAVLAFASHMRVRLFYTSANAVVWSRPYEMVLPVAMCSRSKPLNYGNSRLVSIFCPSVAGSLETGSLILEQTVCHAQKDRTGEDTG